MGVEKGTDQLILATERIRKNNPNSRIKLVLFGKIEDEDTLLQAKQSQVVTLFDWCDRIKTLELLKMADVACWPIHHTTLIEDAVAVCIPLIIRKTDTTEHLIEDNGIWIENGSAEAIERAMSLLLNQDEMRKSAMQQGCEKMKNRLSYNTIAEKVVKDIYGSRQ
jgi:glycosyltransferase involved in cell wall biosynthesis